MEFFTFGYIMVGTLFGLIVVVNLFFLERQSTPQLKELRKISLVAACLLIVIFWPISFVILIFNKIRSSE